MTPFVDGGHSTRSPWLRCALWLCAGLFGCSGADSAAPRTAPCPTALAATSAAPEAAPPLPVTDEEVEYVFTDPDRRKKLESAFPALDQMAEKAVREAGAPGLMLGVVIDGELAHAKGFGYNDIDKKTKPDLDTIYPLASTSKAFTALAALALRDDGALGLDNPLTRWIPEARTLVYPSADALPITLRQMLSHTSGLPRIGGYERARYEHVTTEQELLGGLSGVTLFAAPDTQFWYSNLAFGLLGVTVGRASHSSLEAFVSKRILEPLGMTSTGYDSDKLPAAHIPTYYKKDESGKLVPIKVLNSGALDGAGGLFSTTRDMARFLAFQMAAYPPRSGPDAGPIRRSTLREAHMPRGKGWPLTVSREAPGAEGLVSVEAVNYGFGWINIESCDFDRVLMHNGGDLGGYNWVGFVPESGVGVMTFSNHMGGPYLAMKALKALQQTGGLSKRVARRKHVPQSFSDVMPRLLSVLNTWDEAAYKSMLTTPRVFQNMADEKLEIAGYRATHGACTGWKSIGIESLEHGTFELQCERGKLEMDILLNPNDGLIKGFLGTSRDIPAPPALAEAARRIAGLIGNWDEAVYKKHLAPKDKAPRKEAEALFARLRADRGACQVKAFWRWSNEPRFTLSCERGGDLELSVAVDEKNPPIVTSYSIATGREKTCPAQ